MLCNGNNNQLYRCNFRRQYQSAVISVHHDDGANQTSGHAPAGLMYILQLIVFVSILNVKCPCKTVTKVMAGAGLQSFAIVHQTFNRIGMCSTCKSFFCCLFSFDDRNGQHITAEIRIYIEHAQGFFLSLFCGRVCGMPFLP